MLAGGKRHSYRSGEASFKYFLLGSFATAFFLMGIALIYGMTASFDLAQVKDYAQRHVAHPETLFVLGLFFVAVGLSFKIAAVPFHFWSPDVYEGAPTLVTAFMATVVKTAAFVAMYRFVNMTPMPDALGKTLLLMTVLTLFIGNVVALRQSQFKRLMAYSSIAHSGFLLMAVLSNSPYTGQVLFYYTFTYALATVGLFMVLTLAKRAANGDENIRIFRGLLRARPWLGIVTMLLLLSLAGIPIDRRVHREIPGLPTGDRRGLHQDHALRRGDGRGGHLLLRAGDPRGLYTRGNGYHAGGEPGELAGDQHLRRGRGGLRPLAGVAALSRAPLLQNRGPFRRAAVSRPLR
ncbi:MAG: NADH-quinone oxidoreductase subunit N [Flavobacteriales bacterium]